MASEPTVPDELRELWRVMDDAIVRGGYRPGEAEQVEARQAAVVARLPGPGDTEDEPDEIMVGNAGVEGHECGRADCSTGAAMSDQLTAAQLGWVAGLLDLRGRMSDRPSSHADRRLPTVELTLGAQNGEAHPIITWLCDRTAVTPIRHGKGFNRSGCGEHCPKPHVHVANVYDRWIVGGAKAVVVLRSVLPFLVARRDDAAALLALEGRAYKPMHFAEMTRLGWPS